MRFFRHRLPFQVRYDADQPQSNQTGFYIVKPVYKVFKSICMSLSRAKRSLQACYDIFYIKCNVKVEKEALPRDQPVLHLLLRMLALGLSAWEMIETQAGIYICVWKGNGLNCRFEDNMVDCRTIARFYI